MNATTKQLLSDMLATADIQSILKRNHRVLLAASALQGLLTGPSAKEFEGAYVFTASEAVNYADAVIREIEETETQK